MNINAMLLDVKSYYLAVAVQVTGTFNLKSLCLWKNEVFILGKIRVTWSIRLI